MALAFYSTSAGRPACTFAGRFISVMMRFRRKIAETAERREDKIKSLEIYDRSISYGFWSDAILAISVATMRHEMRSPIQPVSLSRSSTSS